MKSFLSLFPKRHIHFLHIGKNAGSEISRYIDYFNTTYTNSNVRLRKCPHSTFLKDIPVTDPYFFSIRNPISRFVSGFYSRKRKGMPRIYNEWSTFERLSFEHFKHANDLAEVLFENNNLGTRAFQAIKSISHTSMNQVDWFMKRGNFLDITPPLHIIRQEFFYEDISTLFKKLGVPKVVLESDDILSHKNNYEDIPVLSDLAISNLNRWYAQDLEFYKICSHWLESNK